MQPRFRVGGKVPTNIYEVTDNNPDGVYIGHACKPGHALLMVTALNYWQQLEDFLRAVQIPDDTPEPG